MNAQVLKRATLAIVFLLSTITGQAWGGILYNVTDLGTLGGISATAYDINNNGQVVGHSPTAAGDHHAFLYSNGSMQDLGAIFFHSRASAINNSGQVVGSSYTRGGNWHAFLYEGGSMQDLGTLGGAMSNANDINNVGQIVGKALTETSGNHMHAFLYSDGVMWDLQDMIDPASGWTLTEANAINENGWIVGSGMLDGHSGGRAFLLTPIPEPSSLIVWSVLGGLGIATTLWRKRKPA